MFRLTLKVFIIRIREKRLYLLIIVLGHAVDAAANGAEAYALLGGQNVR